MACKHSTGFISLVSILVLLLHSRIGNFAPAHHLKIGVEGNTPTLIVTSAEIGIASNVEVSTSLEKKTENVTELTTSRITTATSPLTSTKWHYKTNKPKMKGKSLKSLYEKKQDKSTKEKTTTRQSKNLMVSSVSPVMPQDVKTLKKPLKTATPTIDSYSITTEQQRELPDIEAAKNNEFKVQTKRIASLTTVPTFRHTEMTTTRSTLKKQMESMKTGTIIPSTTSIVPGKLPQRTASTKSNSNIKIMMPLTTTTPPKMITPTTTKSAEKIIFTTTVPSTTHNNVDVASHGNTKAMPQALLEKTDSTMKTTSMFAVNLTPSVAPAPVITTEVNGISSNMEMTLITTVENKVSDVSAHYIRDVNRKPVTITQSPYSVMNTQSTVNATILTTPSEEVAENTDKIVTKVSTKDLDSLNLRSYDTKTADDTTQHAVIKLIDLEKHEPISIDELRTKARTLPADDGHDGIKKTKKKQLLDKHFIVDTTTQLDFETNIETSTFLPISIAKSVVNDNTDSFVVAQHNIEKPTLMAPTLMPVHKGYLGPIRMDEHTFSVQKSDERPKAHEHVASIESKLHDGRIVEIIAPTALLQLEDTTSNVIMQKDISTTIEPQKNNQAQQRAVLSTTVFQVQEHAESTTRKPINISKSSNTLDERRESKISDIQIEIYDSIVEPKQFKYNKNNEFKITEVERGTTKPSLLLPTTQERFTQYVVDRTEASTPDTIIDANMTYFGIGKPEPAAIEIHINVSEGIANQSEDLEFSFRQPQNAVDELKANYDRTESNSLSSRSQISLPNLQNEFNNERSDDILVVEIIDTGDNSTETQSINSVNPNPVLTIRAESSVETGTLQMADELFMADMKRNGNTEFVKAPVQQQQQQKQQHPPPPPPPPPLTPTVDHDSDTIFYISNTEVKVGESPPSSINDDRMNGMRQEQMRRTRLENQFFPTNYVASTHPNTVAGQRSFPKHIYEEDIILSPIRNTADSLKIFRSQDDGAPPLDITYVGESMIEVEQSSGAGTITTTTSAIYARASSPSPSPSLLPSSSSLPSQTPDVIIQPAILPEMSIGVPVIGELPPQIELKEIDFMPNEANQQRSGVYETENNDIEENLSDSNNDIERLVESSIQYGGDLIDEGADNGGGFDSIEGSYPFGNMAAMHRRIKNNGAADYAHSTIQHGVNNLRKNELSVDVANIARELTLGGIGKNENSTTFQSGNETLASMNITYAIAERMEGNATAFSTVEQIEEVLQLRTSHEFGSFELLFIGGILMLLTVVTLMASYVSCHIYKRVHGNAQESESSELNLPNGTVARCEGGEGGSKGDESSTQPSTPPTKEDSSEHDSTNDRNCLPVSDDSNFKKPSNNSNSLNIVNEKQIKEKSVNKRSTDTPRRIEQEANGQSNNSVPDSYAGPNGSVTKMTLKNNHLIVETEERNDISRDARETKMHYTSDKDGVFVVEVARGADSKIIPESPIAELTDNHLFVNQPKLNGNNNKSPTRKFEDEPAVLNNHEQVQVHQPPTELHTSNTERSLHQIEEVEEEALVSPKVETIVEMNFEQNVNTGLSQSDLSSTSSGDSNKRYTYGNQILYTIDQADYTSNSPGNKNTTPKSQTANKIPDDDHTSENGHNCNETPEKSKGNGNTEEQCELQDEVKSEEILQNDASKQEENQEQEEIKNPIEKIENVVRVEIEIKAELVTEAEVEPNNLELEVVEIQEDAKQNDTEKILSVIVKEIPQIENNEDRMSIDEVDYIVESVNTDTNMTQNLTQAKTLTSNDIQQDIQVDFESLVQAETDQEFAYDSLMSLPDPPSNDEMTQYSDFNGIETSQLDSLPPPPPPPPPPPALLTDENTNMPDIVAEIKSKQCQMQSINGNIEHYNGNGNLNGQHELSNQNNSSQALPSPPPILVEEINSNGKILPNSPLTPPESPPPSPPAQYSNGVIGMNEQLCAASVHAVAVDVNGS